MKRIILGNRLTPLLLLACLLLAGVLALQLHGSSRAPAKTGNETQPAAAPQVELAQSRHPAPDKQRFSEILERPLFDPSRQPPPEPLASAAPAAQTAPIRLKLEGVAITPEAKVAVLRDLSNNQLLRLAEGVEHQGWLVERVSPESATLTRGEQSHELSLELEPSQALPARRVIPTR